MDRERPDLEQFAADEKPKKPDGMTRRTLLKRGLQVAGGVALGAVAGKEFIDHEVADRTRSVAEMGEFLRGKKDGKIEMFGREFTYEQLIDLLTDLIKPQRESRKTVQALLESFTYMMEVEDKFGGKFNTLPILESIDRFTEKVKLDVASSFGFGQINAQSARSIAIEKGEHLVEQKLITLAQLERLKTKGISEHEIVDLLDLSGNGNVPISFLYFVEGYDQYGRTTRGRVHGIPEEQRKRGILSADRKSDPRAFGLAVSAYSAKLESPMAAKAQTYLNEMMLADKSLQVDDGKLLDTDGDLGPNTVRVLNEISIRLGVQVPFTVEQLKTPGFDKLGALDHWLAQVRPHWSRRIDRLYKDQDKDPKVLKEIVSHRYHGAVSVYNLLRKMHPDKQARVHELFLAFADHRAKGLLDLVDDREKFEKEMGSDTYGSFLKRLNRNLPNIINYDERYRGYIPMGYAAASRFLADPKNIMMRVLMAHESEADPRFKISLN